MAKLIEQPEQLKAELKDKLLDYYQENSLFILGILTTFEPQLKVLFDFAPEHPNTLLAKFDLDFDPEIELKKRPQKETSAAEYLDKIRKEIKT